LKIQGDGVHDLVGSLAIVCQHGVPHSTGEAIRKLVGTDNDGIQDLAFLRSHLQKT
jgi:hypothetical protein